MKTSGGIPTIWNFQPFFAFILGIPIKPENIWPPGSAFGPFCGDRSSSTPLARTDTSSQRYIRAWKYSALLLNFFQCSIRENFIESTRNNETRKSSLKLDMPSIIQATIFSAQRIVPLPIKRKKNKECSRTRHSFQPVAFPVTMILQNSLHLSCISDGSVREKPFCSSRCCILYRLRCG